MAVSAFRSVLDLNTREMPDLYRETCSRFLLKPGQTDLWVVGSSRKIRVKHPLSAGPVHVAKRFCGDKDRVHSSQKRGVADLKDPAVLLAIIDAEGPKVANRLGLPLLLPPSLEVVLRWRELPIGKIKSVKHQ